MTTVTRRNVLKGGTALAGGMAGILATGRAPAFAQGTTVHWLRWNDFVPASDQLLRKELLPAAEKELGIKINLETVNGNDLQPRVTASVQSGSGPDLIMIFNNQSALYAESVADLSDLAEEISSKEGGLYKYSRAVTSDGKKFNAMPWTIVGAMNSYRKSWFEEVGFTKFPETWDAYYDAGKKLRQRAVRSARLSAIRSAIRRRSSIRCCGRMAARRWNPTARWRSTARTRSTPSSS